jgi:hypothetical protein
MKKNGLAEITDDIQITVPNRGSVKNGLSAK